MKNYFEVPKIENILEARPDIKGFIFDMDGTLVNSECIHSQATVEILKKYNEKAPLTEADVTQMYIGVGDACVYHDLIDKKWIPPEISLGEYILKKNNLIIRILKSLKDFTHLIDPNLLVFLKKARSLKLKVALVTASEEAVMSAFLGEMNLNKYFDLTRSRKDYINNKPHPEPYLGAFKELGLDKNELMIFEDSSTGLQSAKDSGASFAKAAWY